MGLAGFCRMSSVIDVTLVLRWGLEITGLFGYNKCMREIKNVNLSGYFPVKNGRGIRQYWREDCPIIDLYSRIGKDRMLEYLAFDSSELKGFKFVGETAYWDVTRFIEDSYGQWLDI